MYVQCRPTPCPMGPRKQRDPSYCFWQAGFLLPKPISLGETTSPTGIRQRAIVVPWDTSSSENRPWRLSSWGPDLDRLESLRSACGKISWRAPSTVSEGLRGDRQQRLSLVSEHFVVKIWKWSLVPRVSIVLATTNYYRAHWHKNATSQIRECPVVDILMLHPTRNITF